MSLITKADVKKFLGMSEDIHDGMIESLIAETEADFKTRILGSKDAVFDASSSYQSYTEYYDGNGKDSLIVKHFPIRSVTTIHIDTDRSFGASTLVDSNDIIDTKFDSGIIQLDGLLFTWGKKSIKVVYTAGWKASDAPSDFKRILVNYVTATLLEGIGGVNVVENADFIYRPGKLREEAERLEAKYKNFV